MVHFILLLLSLLFFIGSSYGQEVVINEIMSNNESDIQDEDGDYSDWIELYNTSNLEINLNNYSLSDDANHLNKWVMPEVFLSPNSYILVFASGKDRYHPDELHTNFSIAAAGEELFLTDNNEMVLDQTPAVELADNQSLGRLPNGSGDWIVLNQSSPGESNDNNDVLIFSHDQGFFTAPIQLAITSLMGDTLRYTLDGSEPTVSSEVYVMPIQMGFRNNEPNFFSDIPTTPGQSLISYKAWESPDYMVDKANVIRCATFRNGQRTSAIYTRTYFVDSLIFEKYDMPVVSLITDAEHLFDSETGIYVPGQHYNPGNPEWSGNYFMRGDAWERPVHIEFFESDGTIGFVQDAGVRIHGGKTRQASQKSLRMYARNEYGKKYFNYKLFPQKETEQYKRFILRTTMGSWGDQSIIKDDLAHEMVRELNVDFQDYRPVVVFLNGEYWGIHTIKDRIDERYISYTHNIPYEFVEMRDGNANYNSMIAFLEGNDLSESVNYDYIKTQIDVPNFIDYFIAEMFFSNYDWLPNNEEVWRPLTPEGKWRWIFFDLDASMEDPYRNMFYQATNEVPGAYLSTPEGTFLFRQMIKSQEFQNDFVNRFAVVLNHFLNLSVAETKVAALKQLYQHELPSHLNRWKYPDSFQVWENDLEQALLDFIDKRPCIVELNIVAFFNLSSFGFICDDSSVLSLEHGVTVGPNPTTGQLFFQNNFDKAFSGTVRIFSASGHLVREHRSINIESKSRQYEDISTLAPGVYVINFISSTLNTSVRLVKY